MRRTLKALAASLLAATVVLSIAPIANASPQITQIRHSTACKAGLAQLHADKHLFDNRYDRILGGGIIGTACGAERNPSPAPVTCLVAVRMFELASPLFKTENDLALGRGIMQTTCDA